MYFIKQQQLQTLPLWFFDSIVFMIFPRWLLCVVQRQQHHGGNVLFLEEALKIPL
jgi:hypothetical protein